MLPQIVPKTKIILYILISYHFKQKYICSSNLKVKNFQLTLRRNSYVLFKAMAVIK